MGMPDGIGIIDTMMGTRSGATAAKQTYAFLQHGQLKDAGSSTMEMPAEYLFKDVPHRGEEPPQGADLLLPEMDRWGVEKALISVATPEAEDALRRHPDRFLASAELDPNRGMDGVREVVRKHETFGLRALTVFPAGLMPQVAIDAPQMYICYAKTVELGLPVFCCAGIPGPRVPAAPQRVELIDQVMYDFPELVLVTRHGCEPWTDLMVKLMLKWPNLYYSTSAFAPRHYPKAIVDYANTRGADKVIYAGYFPMGLSLERIMTELPAVPFKDDVWPKFLRDNAAKVLGL
jgi:predicted TIM-barrel fold metal-dependent hydrolase